MKTKRLLGIVLIVIGAVLVLFSDYIATQVASGKLQIEKAESQVHTTKSIFSQTPATKSIGNIFTDGAESKIRDGQQKVNQYETLSHNLKIIGIISIVGGIIVFLLGGFRRKR